MNPGGDKRMRDIISFVIKSFMKTGKPVFIKEIRFHLKGEGKEERAVDVKVRQMEKEGYLFKTISKNKSYFFPTDKAFETAEKFELLKTENKSNSLNLNSLEINMENLGLIREA